MLTQLHCPNCGREYEAAPEGGHCADCPGVPVVTINEPAEAAIGVAVAVKLERRKAIEGSFLVGGFVLGAFVAWVAIRTAGMAVTVGLLGGWAAWSIGPVLWDIWRPQAVGRLFSYRHRLRRCGVFAIAAFLLFVAIALDWRYSGHADEARRATQDRQNWVIALRRHAGELADCVTETVGNGVIVSWRLTSVGQAEIGTLPDSLAPCVRDHAQSWPLPPLPQGSIVQCPFTFRRGQDRKVEVEGPSFRSCRGLGLRVSASHK